jgi:hypothetical protein
MLEDTVKSHLFAERHCHKMTIMPPTALSSSTVPSSPAKPLPAPAAAPILPGGRLPAGCSSLVGPLRQLQSTDDQWEKIRQLGYDCYFLCQSITILLAVSSSYWIRFNDVFQHIYTGLQQTPSFNGVPRQILPRIEEL